MHSAVVSLTPQPLKHTSGHVSQVKAIAAELEALMQRQGDLIRQLALLGNAAVVPEFPENTVAQLFKTHAPKISDTPS
jgi:hypothetical protein